MIYIYCIKVMIGCFSITYKGNLVNSNMYTIRIICIPINSGIVNQNIKPQCHLIHIPNKMYATSLTMIAMKILFIFSNSTSLFILPFVTENKCRKPNSFFLEYSSIYSRFVRNKKTMNTKAIRHNNIRFASYEIDDMFS